MGGGGGRWGLYGVMQMEGWRRGNECITEALDIESSFIPPFFIRKVK